MENNELPEVIKSNNKKSIAIVMLISFLVISWLFSYIIISHQSDDLDSKHKMIIKEMTDNSNCIYKRDSLAMEVKRLSIYESLSRAMALRDGATILLYKVGDIAYSKIDSSKVVISDIIIGGSKYDYYVKYKIIHKDNTIEEVVPELIY